MTSVPAGNMFCSSDAELERQFPCLCVSHDAAPGGAEAESVNRVRGVCQGGERHLDCWISAPLSALFVSLLLQNVILQSLFILTAALCLPGRLFSGRSVGRAPVYLFGPGWANPTLSASLAQSPSVCPQLTNWFYSDSALALSVLANCEWHLTLRPLSSEPRPIWLHGVCHCIDYAF